MSQLQTAIDDVINKVTHWIFNTH